MGLRAKFQPAGSSAGVWKASKGQEVKGRHWAERHNLLHAGHERRQYLTQGAAVGDWDGQVKQALIGKGQWEAATAEGPDRGDQLELNMLLAAYQTARGSRKDGQRVAGCRPDRGLVRGWAKLDMMVSNSGACSH
ncbi:TPA: hypothetical protein ACH3X1_015737 [Trebouxia sp. C0004]